MEDWNSVYKEQENTVLRSTVIMRTVLQSTGALDFSLHLNRGLDFSLQLNRLLYFRVTLFYIKLKARMSNSYSLGGIP